MQTLQEPSNEVQLLQLTPFEKFKALYKVFIFDIDGTLWNGNTRLPGVSKAVYELMRDADNTVLFYTNGGYSDLQYTFNKVDSWLREELSLEQYDQIARRYTKKHVYNTAQLTGRYLTKLLPAEDKDVKILTIGNPGLNSELINHGFHGALLLETSKEGGCGMTDQQFGDVEIDKSVKAVVKGVCGDFDFHKITMGSLYLQQPDCLFVATNEDHVFRTGKSGRRMPDVGATLRALEAAADRKAVTVGKPEPFALQIMLEDHFADKEREWKESSFLSQFVYVGDNMETDIMFSKNAGIASCLVLSGMTPQPSTQEEADIILKHYSPDSIMLSMSAE